MGTAMENLKQMVDVNTVVGEAVESQDGTLVIPVSRVTLGFFAGGSDWPGEEGPSHPFGGGSGAGISVQPVAFLVVGRDHIRLLPISERASWERVADLIPDIWQRLQNREQPGPVPPVTEESS
ncbi:MAG: GerW family sporulation protein [Clostridiales bacterium]|nr:GerW family sporulation protein [Clostridiales bacterium]